MKIDAYTQSERAEVRTIARRHMLFVRECYLWAKGQVNNPMSSLPDNGMALNVCKRYKEIYRKAADRLKTICYDCKNERPGGPGVKYANECPGCGNLQTFNHSTYWPYYCHKCEWGFGYKREIENESPCYDVKGERPGGAG